MSGHWLRLEQTDESNWTASVIDRDGVESACARGNDPLDAAGQLVGVLAGQLAEAHSETMPVKPTVKLPNGGTPLVEYPEYRCRMCGVAITLSPAGGELWVDPEDKPLCVASRNGLHLPISRREAGL